MTGNDATAAKRERTRPTKGRCPICRRPVVTRFVPFCSRRCADVDLTRWLAGTYVIPSDEREEPAPDEQSGGA